MYFAPQGLRVPNSSVSYPAFPAMLLTHLPLSLHLHLGSSFVGPLLTKVLPSSQLNWLFHRALVFPPLLSSQVTASHPTTRELTARAIQPHHLHLHHHLPTTMGATAATPQPLTPHHYPQLHRPTLSPVITSISR